MSIQLKAGFGKKDITPSYSVPLRGYGTSYKRMSETVLDPIYAICTAVSDGENKALFYPHKFTPCQCFLSIIKPIHAFVNEKSADYDKNSNNNS